MESMRLYAVGGGDMTVARTLYKLRREAEKANLAPTKQPSDSSPKSNPDFTPDSTTPKSARNQRWTKS